MSALGTPSSRSPALDSPDPPRGTQALRRGLAVVQAVADGARTLAEISTATGLTKSTAHRLAQGLVCERIIAETGQGHYRLGGRLISWGGAAIAENPVTEVAGPVLAQLSETTQDTVHLACEDADTVFYLHKIDGRRGATMRSRVGGREPLIRTGIGKALLLDGADRWEHLADAAHSCRPSSTGDEHADFPALMAHYARRGIAMDIEENEPGIRCVAAPVRDAHGRIVAAISVSATTPYMASERMEALVDIVGSAARDISIGLGARPPFRPTG
ncbi:IclR family transcriptional regulator [Brachybacterium fresconis]|uniref:DNA-binding IclR family transcriptional regulator n=1 Tax=Brachybacterium fresconis TaxID=173363 RepID=A0ABS4YIU9_9MICO|nr:IclR family transcriptional regulator [Brachybacterium fresconis]MBP2408664.1 DNA-binding IclR family transcriptional regulator [Brachybacterium fresconis]